VKEIFKQLGIKKWSLVAFLALFALAPLPGFEGGPTGLVLVHNHAERYIKRNEQAIANNHESAAHHKDKMGDQFNIYLIRNLIHQTEESTKLSPEVKASRLRRYENELNRHEKSIHDHNKRLDKLNSLWEGYGIAQSGEQGH